MVRHPFWFFLPVALLGGAALILGAIAAHTSGWENPVQLTWAQLSNLFYWIAGASALALMLMWVAYARGKRRQVG